VEILGFPRSDGHRHRHGLWCWRTGSCRPRAPCEVGIQTWDSYRGDLGAEVQRRRSGAVALSSGEGGGQPVRHRLDTGGNRRVNSVLHIVNVTQQRDHPDTQTYLVRKTAQGKTRREARRAHKRHLANPRLRRMWRDEYARRMPVATAA